MPGTPKLPSSVRRLFRLPWSRQRMARDLDDEVRFHLEARITDLRARGLSAGEAEAEALRQFGDIEDLRLYCSRVDRRGARRARVLEWLDRTGHDLYHTGR